MIPWLTQRSAATPDAPALVIEDRPISFAELEAGVRATAERFRSLGLRRGDVVATLLWNGRAFVEALHATALCGATLLPLNARSTGAELAYCLRDASARLLIHGGDELAARAASAAGEAGGIARIAVEAGAAASLGQAGAPHPREDPLRDRVDRHTPLAILYTSGTTGRPKGACLSFENFLWNAGASALHLGACAQDRWLACLPLFHVGGLAILVRSVLAGCSVVLHERFDAPAVARSLCADGITHVSLVPTMLSRVLEANAGRPAPATLRCVLVGGAPVPASLLARARALGFPVAPTYGLTEATSQVATCAPGSLASGAADLARPLPGVELRIEGEDGVALAAGGIGEICVRGPIVMAGYLGLPAETAHALRGGWLHTGDVGVLGADGNLRVLDRRSDLVISGGENVYPAEVEAVLAAHPEVLEAAVAGEPDGELGQRVVAAVVLRDAACVDEAMLREFCRAQLAGYKLPRRIAIVAALPRTSSGKILRRSLARVLPGR